MSSSDKPKKGFSIANIRRKASFKKGNSNAPTDVTSVEGAGARDEIDLPQSPSGAVDGERMAQDQEKLLALERDLQEAREQVKILQTKAAQYENASAELDDDSFDAAQVFQLKKELTEIREELAKHDEVKQELTDTKQELSEFRAQNEELLLQQSRKSTRTDMQRIRTEKTTREEVDRLHKELRQMERNSISQTSMVEAQLKVSKDSLQRAAEKAQAVQRRLDLVDKERMDLKLENQRLSRKLEKSDSYAEKKRAQIEAETHQMEMANLKRKTVKLEKQLSLSTMNLSNIDELGGSFNVNSPIRIDSRTDSRLSSGSSSPVPMTLSEARIEKLEKEVYTLEERNSVLETQQEELKDELAAANQKAMILISQVEQIQAGIGDEKQAEEVLTQLPQFNSVPPSSGGSTHNEEILQQEVMSLKKELESKATELRVRVKEMKATNDELKRQVEELEMEKLRLELGEGEEGEELTDTEEEEKLKEGTEPPQADESEVKVLRERLMSLQDELLQVSQSNNELQTTLEKQKEEAELFVRSIESELAEEEKKREEKLTEENKELKSKLKEQQEKYSEMVKEIARLKAIIEDQEDEILLLKVQKEQLEKQFPMGMESSQEEPALLNSDVIAELISSTQFQEPPPSTKDKSPPPTEEKDVTPTPESVTAPLREEKVATPPPAQEKEKVATPPPAQEKEKVATPPPAQEKEKKKTKKIGGILSSKKSKLQSQAAVNEVDGGAPPPQQKKAPPAIKKRPPRDWPPKPKK